jgi:CheY-like chemotaxis protein
MPKGGRLTIGTGLTELDEEFIIANGYGEPGRYALVTVSDTGSGMDAGTLGKIFEPFFTTKDVGQGTGLGLSLAYGIVKQHGGYINVYSEAGKGTLFRIMIPLMQGTDETAREAEPFAAPAGGTETILVAEDDASLRRLARVILETFGYKVITAEDGEDAIEKFRENRERIDLLLLDVIMPRRNGREVCEEIRKTDPDIKTLFMSGYARDVINDRDMIEGVLDFITKPVLPKDLLKKVRERLDK